MRHLSLSLQLKLFALGIILAFATIIGWNTLTLRHNQTLIESALTLSEERLSRAIRMEGYVHTNVARIRATAASNDDALGPLLAPDIAATEAAFVKELKAFEAQSLNADERQALAQLTTDTGAAIRATERIQQLKANNQLIEARRVLTQEFDPAAQGLLNAAGRFQQLQQAATQATRAALEEDSRTALYASLILGVLIALAVIIVLELMRRQITSNLTQVAQFTQRVASGDLTGELHTQRRDELGELVRSVSAMSAALGNLVAQVRDASQQIQDQAEEITHGSTELSARTEQTASNLEETAASIEQLASTVTQSAESAQQANLLAASAAQAADHGGTVVGDVVTSMQHISESSRKIADIIGVIDSIAFQTNILALNAAVEAARAGEQGRGFAVVAGEVRTLAQRSASAAKEIKELITTSVNAVQTGSTQVSQAGVAMDEIVSGVRRVSSLISEITVSSGEQRDGINQVNQAVNNVDQMTQQNAAQVEESSASAVALQAQARRLTELVSVFTIASSAQGAARPALASQPAAATRLAASAPARSAPARVATSTRTAATAAPTRVAAPAASTPPSAARKALPSQPAKPTAKASDDDDWETF